ncbi:MAG TPA: DHA2 family efflux MFS transporter permease subunit [Magnetospirillaceae bacterium]|jgi:DHA2 family multidrug resistance protein
MSDDAPENTEGGQERHSPLALTASHSAAAAVTGRLNTSPEGTTAPWLVAPVVAMAAFMEVLDISIANVSLQHISGDLAASQDESTWVLTSYLVTNAIVLPISGWLASVIGRKRLFISCIVGFSIASLLCGLAPNLEMLILFRAIQGLTGGGLQPLSQSILADSFPPKQRGMAFALFGIAVVFAPAIGPTLGGWITDTSSWRWVFLLNVPVGIILTILLSTMIQDSPELVKARLAKLKQGLRLDYLGFALITLGFGCLQVVLDKGQEDDWLESSFIVWMCIISVVSLIAFAIWELGQDDPIVDLRLLADRNFLFANILMFVLGFVLLGSTVLLPELVQLLLGYTATDAGLVLTPGGFAIMALMPLIGRMVSTMDSRHMIAFGLTTCALALFHMTTFDLYTDYNTFMWGRIYQACGLAFLFIPINTAAFRGIAPQKSAAASAIINVSRNIGGSVGISLVTTELAQMSQVHQTFLVAHASMLNLAYRDTLSRLSSLFHLHGDVTSSAQLKAAGEIFTMINQQASMQAFLDGFKLLGITMIVLAPFVYVMRSATMQNRGGGGGAH